jgi:hypothetical protein
MPQTTYLPLYAAMYPILAKAQKPGGVTVLTTVGAGDVPNKPTFTAGTIQIASMEGPAEETAPEAEQETESEDGEEDPEPTKPRRSHHKKR